MKKSYELVRVGLPSGTNVYIRPEFIAAVVEGESCEVVLTNYQTALKCTLESAERVVEALRDAPAPIVLPPQTPPR